MKTWAGGGGWARASPPRPRPQNFKRRRPPGLSNTRYKHKKKSKNIILRTVEDKGFERILILLLYTQKT